MSHRNILTLVALVAVIGSNAQGPQKYYCAHMCSRKDLPCPSPCRTCPKVPPCPAPFCPHAECPVLSSLPSCPEPICPPLPKIPACPKPVVQLSCPHIACPQLYCPSCPTCPEIRPCATCPTPPPTTQETEVTETGDTETEGRTEATHFPMTVLPNGYVKTAGVGTYKFYRTPQSWRDANTTCSQDGAYLAVINSEEEKNLLLRQMMEAPLLHVGFYAATPGVYVNITGQPMTTYQRSLWRRGEPTGGPRFACVYLSGSSHDLVTEICDDREVFICEMS